MAEALHKSREYGYDTPLNIPFNYASFKAKRDANILSLNAAYERNWSREGITLIHGTASFISPNTLSVVLEDGSGTQVFTAKHICIATGGAPIVPEIKGSQFAITSDGFFEMEGLPKSIALVGAGYIAVELAGMLNAVGVEVHMFIRGQTFLRGFDPMIQETMTRRYEGVGVKIYRGYTGFDEIENLKKEGQKKKLRLRWEDGELEIDELLFAIGRRPETASLDLDKAGVKLDGRNCVVVDEFQNTSVEGIYALGDVTGQVDLTPGMIVPLGSAIFELIRYA
jgi:glutathione reductase (NADPH)